MSYVNIRDKLFVSLLPAPVCFNHDSVIQNFFTNAVLKRSIPASEISHKREGTRWRKVLDHKRVVLEDYDDLTTVLTAFREWKKSYEDYPHTLHAHSVDEDGNEKSITWRMLTRFQSNRNVIHLSEALNRYKGDAVFLTLTVDHSRSLAKAWTGIAKRWNAFISRLRIEMGLKKDEKLHYVWVLEAQENGYPHIHAIFLGRKWLFRAGNKSEYENDNPHVKNLKHFWKWGSIFVNRTKTGKGVRNPVSYMMKYIRKTFSKEPTGKEELTQALLWVFNKRSFNTSRGIFKWLGYLKEKFSTAKLISLNIYERLRGQKTPIRILHVEPLQEVTANQWTMEMWKQEDKIKEMRWLYRLKQKSKYTMYAY